MRALLIAAALASSAPAAAGERATDLVVSGAAEGHGEEARTRALDRAFAAAVEQAVDDLLPPEAVASSRDRLASQVIRRARLYVASYRVIDEGVAEGETQVEVATRIDVAALRGALAELGLSATGAAAAAPVAASATSGARPKLVLLVAVSEPGTQRTSFGTTGDEQIESYRAIARALEERGFELVSAAGTRVDRAALGEQGAGTVLADASALDLARKLGAGGAVIVGLAARQDGRIRGTSFLGAQARGVARVLEAGGGRTLATAEADEATWGASAASAAESGLRQAAESLAPQLAAAVSRQWPAARGNLDSDRLAVRIRGASSWSPVAAIIRQLALAHGVSAVHPTDVRGGEVLLGIETSLPVAKIVGLIRRTSLGSGSLSARVSGDGVLVTVQ